MTEDLTKEQLKKLLKTFNEANNTQVATMLKMVLYTGMRRGKLMKLQWNDLDFENSFIHIRGPKGGVYQVIPMNNSAYEILKNYPRTSSKFVFLGIKGKQLVNPNEEAKKN